MSSPARYGGATDKSLQIQEGQSIFPDHDTIRVETNFWRKLRNTINTWKLNTRSLNNQQAKTEIQNEILNFLETNVNEKTRHKSL